VTLPGQVHFVEPGGRGGVFQHTAEIARMLARSGVQVIIHTASDFESVDLEHVGFCRCVRWHRTLRPQILRRPFIVGDYLIKTLPHLRRISEGRVVHVQGLFVSPLYALTLLRLRARSGRLVFSPHNTFSRAGRAWQERVLRKACRIPDVVVSYSSPDTARLERWAGTAVIQCPLVQLTPDVSPAAVQDWRSRLAVNTGEPLLMIAGQIREDKGVDAMIRASKLLRQSVQLAVVGEDKGDLERCQQIARDHGVHVAWVAEYLPLEAFAAAIAAADVVVLPYRQASQSGVLSLAAALGTPTVAYPVGGLCEAATVTAERSDERALAAAIDLVLGTNANFPPKPENRLDWLERTYQNA